MPGNVGLCGNRTSSRQSVFETTVDGLLSNLSIATPKIPGFFAAATAPVNGTNTSTAYGIAQCAPTVTSDGCGACLQVAYANIKSCATDVTDGRGVDSGCFMRYSASPFFPNNTIMDITPFLQDGKTSENPMIIFLKYYISFENKEFNIKCINMLFPCTGGSSNKGAIIGGVVGGVGGLIILLIILILLWYRRSKKRTSPGSMNCRFNCKQLY